MPITFRRLQVFVAAAEDGNFRKTADRLGISQPSVSAQIRAIEQHLGYPLFERRRGVSSTLAREGREFLVRARTLVEAEQDLVAERQMARRPQVAVLRVSVGPILLERRVKPMLPQFYEKHPDIALEFVPFNPSSDREQAIRSGAIDALLYTGGAPARTSPRAELIGRVSCSIYGAPEVASRLRGPPEEISAAPFVIPPRDYLLSQFFEAQLAIQGIRPRNVVARPPYMDVVLQMVLAGKGLAVLFDEHAAEHTRAGTLRVVGSVTFTAHRVMLLGRRALRPEVSPALQFLRSLLVPGDGAMRDARARDIPRSASRSDGSSFAGTRR